MRIAIVGAGSFGTTLAHLWSSAGHEVHLGAREPEGVDSINHENRNCLFNSQFDLHPAMRAHGELGAMLDGAEAVFLAVPSKFLRKLIPQLGAALQSAQLPEGIPFVSVVKGMLVEPTELVSAFAQREFADIAPTWVQFCGPNLSVEIMDGQPTASVVACADTGVSARLQHELSTPGLRLYTNQDPVGVEVCGALKNILAVASGIATGLGLGLNIRGVLLTRGVVEMRRVLPVFGGDPHTLYGLAGFGDIIATAFSENSRNFRAGMEFSKGMSLTEVEGETKMVAEGVRTVKALMQFVEEQHPELDLPITCQVHAVIYEGKPPKDAIAELMSRPHKEEA